MSSPYMSRPVRACFDGEAPVDEAPILEPVEVEAVEPETPEPVVELFSAEQLAERLAARDAEWQARLSEKDTEVAQIRSKYDTATVERALADAISRGDAFSVEQVMPLLRGHTSIIDGSPVVRIEGFVMSPSEAVAWMRSQPDRYGNLFKSNVIGGLGMNSTADGMRGRPQNVRTMSPATYRSLRESNPSSLGFDQ